MLRILSLNSFIKSWLNIQSFLDDVPVPSLLMSRESSILIIEFNWFYPLQVSQVLVDYQNTKVSQPFCDTKFCNLFSRRSWSKISSRNLYQVLYAHSL